MRSRIDKVNVSQLFVNAVAIGGYERRIVYYRRFYIAVVSLVCNGYKRTVNLFFAYFQRFSAVFSLFLAVSSLFSATSSPLSAVFSQSPTFFSIFKASALQWLL